ncbi:Flotillin-1 [Zootermopsis nevadensis]|uniref:Flotillin-1 n=1 Tax=Zootermopsis nevadensis TaxID=136037 RepID=A0A067R602_ZOONE|nr:Flotillin-1 [Zootermopsis nevadensis]
MDLKKMTWEGVDWIQLTQLGNNFVNIVINLWVLLEKLAEANRNRVILEAEAEAESVRVRGEAEAFAIEAKARAEAEQMAKKADAWKDYKEAAMVDMLLDTLPKVAAEVAAPLSQAKKITMVSSGQGEIGAAKLTGEVLSIVSRVPEVVKNLTGVDIIKISMCLSSIYLEAMRSSSAIASLIWASRLASASPMRASRFTSAVLAIPKLFK